MIPSYRIVFPLPPFDTGSYEECEFLMSGGDAYLTVIVANIAPIKIQFTRARWHEFTALHNCSSEQIKGAYFALAEVLNSDRLHSYIANDQAFSKAYSELHHYRIFLDETGCHEVFAQEWAVL